MSININALDLETIKADANKKKYAEIGYITEYPDVTIVYIRHEYTKGSNYLLIKDNGLMNATIKRLSIALEKAIGIKLYPNEQGSCKTVSIMAQPVGYKVS